MNTTNFDLLSFSRPITSGVACRDDDVNNCNERIQSKRRYDFYTNIDDVNIDAFAEPTNRNFPAYAATTNSCGTAVHLTSPVTGRLVIDTSLTLHPPSPGSHQDLKATLPPSDLRECHHRHSGDCRCDSGTQLSCVHRRYGGRTGCCTAARQSKNITSAIDNSISSLTCPPMQLRGILWSPTITAVCTDGLLATSACRQPFFDLDTVTSHLDAHLIQPITQRSENATIIRPVDNITDIASAVVRPMTSWMADHAGDRKCETRADHQRRLLSNDDKEHFTGSPCDVRTKTKTETEACEVLSISEFRQHDVISAPRSNLTIANYPLSILVAIGCASRHRASLLSNPQKNPLRSEEIIQPSPLRTCPPPLLHSGREESSHDSAKNHILFRPYLDADVPQRSRDTLVVETDEDNSNSNETAMTSSWWPRCNRRASEKPSGKLMTSSGTEKKYRCELCGRMFSRSNTLATHRRIHTGEKPFSCDVCGRRFRQPGNLTRHQLTHYSDKAAAFRAHKQ